LVPQEVATKAKRIKSANCFMFVKFVSKLIKRCVR
jgi:hypothetical protein